MSTNNSNGFASSRGLEVAKKGSEPSKRKKVSLKSSLNSLNLGTLRITGEVEYEAGYRKISAKCVECGRESLRYVDNLLSGKTKNCRCQGKRKYEQSVHSRILGERYDSIFQRCNNPSCPAYPDYGGRGIKLRFFNREEFISWGLDWLFLPHLPTHQLDRIDNEGHYEPDNLRLVPQGVNLRNKRSSRKVDYKGRSVNANDLWHLLKSDNPHFSLSKSHTAKLAGQGVDWCSIIARKARKKRKDAPEPQPNQKIVALYRGTE